MVKHISMSDGRISHMLGLQPDDILLITSSNTQISGIVDILVVGDNEKANGTVTVRKYGEDEQTTMAFDEFVTMINHDIETYSRKD